MRQRALATLLPLLLLALPAAGQQEGYDPMRVLASSSSRPNIVIVLDASDHMNRCDGGVLVGPDAAGAAPTAAWGAAIPGMPNTCTPASKNKRWTYKLTVTQSLPSRMAIVKNALGEALTIYPPWVPPATLPAFSNQWSGVTLTVTSTYTAPSDAFPQATWDITVTGVWGSCVNAPGNPFTASLILGGYAAMPPRGLLRQAAASVNWGLVTYGGSACPGATLRVPVDVGDTGDTTAILNLMKATTAGGLSAGGAAPIRGGLQVARQHLASTFANDPRFDCNRTYGMLLLAGDVSDSCNGASGPWTTCPSGYTASPAVEAEALWIANWTNGGTSVAVNGRTWVLGMQSAAAMPCEFNYIAYMGRTDANAPDGDTGMFTSADPYLPEGPPGTFDTAHGNYAFPASDSQSIWNSFNAILGSCATASGNFVWNAITVTSRTGLPTLAGLVGTSEYPGWRGHLYVFDLLDGSLLYDVGDRLQQRDLSADPRKIWTWNSSLGLVAVEPGNLAALQAICGCTLNSNVIDFIHGKDVGALTRTWRLGSPINSVPAVVTGPSVWDTTAGQSPSHQLFQQTYSGRHSMVYVGASDGMMHAFDAVDGYEVFAILPPDQLAKQVTLYNNWVTNPVANPVGQPPNAFNHIYGVANSPRVGDVFFPQGSSGVYKTLLFLTGGPGSKSVAALDVTHPYPGRTNVALPGFDPPLLRDYYQDPNYSATAPFEVAWYKTQTNIPQLNFTYSVPAVASTVADDRNPKFQTLLGSGFNPASTASSQVAPTLLALSSVDGGVVNAVSLANLATPAPFVGNQADSNSVMFTLSDRYFQEGFPATVAIQPDLNGRIWFVQRPAGTTGTPIVDATAHAGQPQPIYYPPAVAGFKSKLCMVFGSGSFYERSPNINGGNAPFRARLYVTAKPRDFSVIAPSDSSRIKSWRLTDLDNGTGQGETFSDQAAILSQPTLLVPSADLGEALAVFSVFDPGHGDCGGRTAVVTVRFDPDNLSSANAVAFDVSQGLIVGFGIYGTNVYTATRDSEGNLTVTRVSGVDITSGHGSQLKPIWWREVQ